MSVYDWWHLTHPDYRPGWNHKDPEQRLQPCRCGRGRNKLYPTGIRGTGKRWQVRWSVVDDDGKRHQPERNFSERYGDDSEQHAEAWDAMVNADLDSDNDTDPELAKITLRDFARQWQAVLTGDSASLDHIGHRLAHITGRDGDETAIYRMAMSKLARTPSAI